MRLNGTKYTKIDRLPNNAEAVSLYAKKLETSAPYIYIMYERFLNRKGRNPGYSIKCFQGTNYIIPE